MVEFALTAPLLVLLLMGLIELGNGLNSYLTVLASTRDAARLGGQTGVASLTPLQTLITNETSKLKNAPIPTTPNCPVSNDQRVCITSDTSTEDKWLDVKVCYDHPFIVRIPWLMNGPLKMCTHTKMRIVN